MFGRQFGKKIPHAMGNQILPLEMWFWYQLQYWPKVSADLGFDFGIGPT